MYHCILLCYNGTLEGRCVLREGAELAQRFGARTHLLAVSRLDGSTVAGEAASPAAPFADLREALERVLDEGVQHLRDMGLAAVGHLAFGEPVTEIVTCARSIGADLIVVGHRHRGALARWWSSSVDATLLQEAPCSLLIAMNDERHGR